MQLRVPEAILENPDHLPREVEVSMSDHEMVLMDDFVGIGASAEVMFGADIDVPQVRVTSSKLLAERIHADRRLADSCAAETRLSLYLPEIDMLQGLLFKGLFFDAARRRVPFSQLHEGNLSWLALAVQRGLRVAQSFHWLSPEVAADNFSLYNESPRSNLLFIGSSAEEFSFPLHSTRLQGQSLERWFEVNYRRNDLE